MNRVHAFILLLSLAAFIAPTLAQADSAGVHVKRGKDWTSLKNYQKARTEFNTAINMEPKSKEARYGIAYTYYLQDDLLTAVKWLRQIQRYAPHYKKAEELINRIRSEGYRRSENSDSGIQTERLRIITATLSSTAEPYLEKLMGVENRRNALKAAALLSQLSPKAVHQTWIMLLQDANDRVRYRAAKQLWDTERYKPAATVLRTQYANEFLSASGSKARRAAANLIDLGFEGAKPILLEAVRDYKSYDGAVTWYAVKYLTAHNAKAVVPILIHTIDEELTGKHDNDGCKGPNRTGLYKLYAQSLAALDAKESVQAIEAILSNTLSNSFSKDNFPCIDSYLADLASLGGRKWKKFDYWYREGGHSQFSMVFQRFKCFKNGNSHCRHGDAFDSTSPNAWKFHRVAKFLGSCNIFAGCKKGYDLEPQFIWVDGPLTVDYQARVKNTRQKKEAGQVVFVLHATGNHKRAWVMTDVKRVQISGVGNVLER